MICFVIIIGIISVDEEKSNMVIKWLWLEEISSRTCGCPSDCLSPPWYHVKRVLVKLKQFHCELLSFIMFNGSIPVRSNEWKLHSLLVTTNQATLLLFPAPIETDSVGRSGREEEVHGKRGISVLSGTE